MSDPSNRRRVSLDKWQKAKVGEDVIYHGGCIGCTHSQKKPEGVTGRCGGCRYFAAQWDKPNFFETSHDYLKGVTTDHIEGEKPWIQSTTKSEPELKPRDSSEDRRLKSTPSSTATSSQMAVLQRGAENLKRANALALTDDRRVQPWPHLTKGRVNSRLKGYPMRTLENWVRGVFHLVSTGLFTLLLAWVGEHASGDPETRAVFLIAFITLSVLNWLIFDVGAKVPKRITQGLMANDPTDQDLIEYLKE